MPVYHIVGEAFIYAESEEHAWTKFDALHQDEIAWDCQEIGKID